MNSLGLYLHIPFCQQRCGYCDFNAYAGISNLIPSYIDALNSEIKYIGKGYPSTFERNVTSIYFGGGTPSLLSPKQIFSTLETINEFFCVSDDCEISLEINPGTVSNKYFKELIKLGINRLSIGVQSADPAELKLLERLHGFPEASLTVEHARQAGFNNLSLDLIYGLPEQCISIWEQSLRSVLTLNPEHLSLYALTIEPGTPMEKKVSSGLLPNVDPDLAADMYDLTREILYTEGFVHYEISNWAKNAPNGELLISNHNRQYWINEHYLGIGAGAHGFISNFRTENIASPIKYIRNFVDTKFHPEFPQTPATQQLTKINKQREMEETVIMGLRLLQEGISLDKFSNRFDEDIRNIYSSEIDKLLGQGLLRWSGKNKGNLLLTEMAYLVANQVFVEFINI